jgi:hypothetical protein
MELPNVAILKLFVEEKRLYGGSEVHVSLRVDTYIMQPSYYVMLKKPMKIQHFLLSWMNSLLLELQNHSTLTQDLDEQTTFTEKELDTDLLEMYFLRSSLY